MKDKDIYLRRFILGIGLILAAYGTFLAGITMLSNERMAKQMLNCYGPGY